MSFFGGKPFGIIHGIFPGYEKGEITTTKQTNMTEMAPLTRGIVIFGATGDLCKKKLIPALYKLWQKDCCQRIFLSLEVLGESLLHRCGRTLLVISR